MTFWQFFYWWLLCSVVWHGGWIGVRAFVGIMKHVGTHPK